MSLQLLVILVPVLFGFMGFAIDLGRLYLVRGELNQAASTMAQAAAAQLIGTSASLDTATNVMQASLDNTAGLANKYNFGSLLIGQSSADLTSTVNPPAFFSTLTDAVSSGSQADGTTARHVQVSLLADTPLLFWGLLSVGQSRKATVGATATAGASAPLCTACGISPFVIAVRDVTDTVNFGFGDPTAGTLYTFAYTCIGTPVPTPLTGPVISYGLINRFDASNATLDITQQLFTSAARGLIGSVTPNPNASLMPMSCVGISSGPNETIWPDVVPALCSSPVPTGVTSALCGLYSRIPLGAAPTACTTAVTDFADLSVAYAADTDLTTGQADPYFGYQGNGQRLITVSIVDVLPNAPTGTMTVLGFRQFLLEPDATSAFNPADPRGRFVAQYVGSPAPVSQGYIDDRFALSCPAPVAAGVSKVVLHQ